jgi:hypothetical protein
MRTYPDPDTHSNFHTYGASCYFYPYPHAHRYSNIKPIPIPHIFPDSNFFSDSIRETIANANSNIFPKTYTKPISTADLDTESYAESYASINSTTY